MNPSQPSHPQQPVKLALVLFVALMAVVHAVLPFQHFLLRPHWLLIAGYCAFLAVASVGLARWGRAAFILLLLPYLLALLPGVLGTLLMWRKHAPLESAGVCLRISLYLFYALAVWVLCLVIRGWQLYFQKTTPATASA